MAPFDLYGMQLSAPVRIVQVSSVAASVISHLRDSSCQLYELISKRARPAHSRIKRLGLETEFTQYF
jgi:hypothetical protein